MKKILIKSKRSEGIFGMSFGMIFSIILMVFFVITAFIAVKYFLNTQKCSQIGLFFIGVQNEVDIAFNADSYDKIKNFTLPTGIKNVCFVDINSPPKNANNIELEIYNHIKITEINDFKANLYLYSPDKNFCDMNWKTIKKISLAENNPICFSVNKNIVSVRFRRNFENPSVFVGD